MRLKVDRRLRKCISPALAVMALLISFAVIGTIWWYIHFPGAVRAAAMLSEGDTIQEVGRKFEFPVAFGSSSLGQDFLISDRIDTLRTFRGDLTHVELGIFDRVVVILSFDGGRLTSKKVIWDDW